MNPQKDRMVMRLLKLPELSHKLATTPKGELTAKIQKDTDTYNFFLDAVPVDREANEQLNEIWRQS